MSNLSTERLGRITASEVHKILNPKGIGKTGESYLWEVLTEKLTGEQEPETWSKALEWGKENEPYASDYFTASTGYELKEIDFQIYNDYAGASPDRIFKHGKFGDTLVEIKCPYRLSNHIQNCKLIKNADDLKKLRFEYYAQIQMQLLCTNLNMAYFVSFCGLNDDLKPRASKYVIHVVKVPKCDEFQTFLKTRLEEAINFIQNYE